MGIPLRTPVFVLCSRVGDRAWVFERGVRAWVFERGDRDWVFENTHVRVQTFSQTSPMENSKGSQKIPNPLDVTSCKNDAMDLWK